MLLVYSVHFKSNRGELEADISKREEAADSCLPTPPKWKGFTPKARRSS